MFMLRALSVILYWFTNLICNLPHSMPLTLWCNKNSLIKKKGLDNKIQGTFDNILYRSDEF